MIDIGNLIVTEFKIRNEFKDLQNTNGVRFCKSVSRYYNGEKWSVRRGAMCLNNTAEFEMEPTPSDRDDSFFKRCRFDSLEQAIYFYNLSNQLDY